MPSGGEGLDALSVETIARFVEDHAPESSTLEFKETLVLNKTETRRDLVRDVTAFANAMGGHIVVGISEQGMPHHAASWAHLSIADAERMRKQVVDLCSSYIDPAIPGLDVQVAVMPNVTSLVLVRVPASRPPHAVTGFDETTDYYIRINDRKRQMTPSELQVAFARASGRRDALEPRDDPPNGRSAVEEALKKAQKQAGGAPFFRIVGAPAVLHADALDLQSQEVLKILAENADGRTIETTLGWVVSKAKTVYRGIAASIGPYAFFLRDDGLMTWTVRVSEDAGFFQPEKEGHAKVFSPFAVVGYPLSFARSFCALRGIMRGTSGPYVIQMAYSDCQDITLSPGHIGLEGYPSTSVLWDVDKERTSEQLIKAPFEPKEFNSLLPADWIARDLIKHFYQAFGYLEEAIPFWDDTAKVFDLDSEKHR